MKQSYTIPNEEEMRSFAEAFAAELSAGDCVLLRGTLGAGKTAFARGAIQTLCGVNTEVVSPTFMLVQEYDSASGMQIMHYDLYRLENVEELPELGVEEALEHALVFVEWPDIAHSFWPDERIEVEITQAQGGDERMVLVSATGSVVGRLEGVLSDWKST